MISTIDLAPISRYASVVIYILKQQSIVSENTHRVAKGNNFITTLWERNTRKAHKGTRTRPAPSATRSHRTQRLIQIENIPGTINTTVVLILKDRYLDIQFRYRFVLFFSMLPMFDFVFVANHVPRARKASCRLARSAIW